MVVIQMLHDSLTIKIVSVDEYGRGIASIQPQSLKDMIEARFSPELAFTNQNENNKTAFESNSNFGEGPKIFHYENQVIKPTKNSILAKGELQNPFLKRLYAPNAALRADPSPSVRCSVCC